MLQCSVTDVSVYKFCEGVLLFMLVEFELTSFNLSFYFFRPVFGFLLALEMVADSK